MIEAVTVALPAATPVTVPLETVATVASLVVHVTTASAGTVVAVIRLFVTLRTTIGRVRCTPQTVEFGSTTVSSRSI